MKCLICKNGDTKPGKVTVSLQRGEGVLADVCEKGGENYLSEEITAQVLSRAEEAVRKGAEVEILRFAA